MTRKSILLWFIAIFVFIFLSSILAQDKPKSEPKKEQAPIKKEQPDAGLEKLEKLKRDYQQHKQAIDSLKKDTIK